MLLFALLVGCHPCGDGGLKGADGKCYVVVGGAQDHGTDTGLTDTDGGGGDDTDSGHDTDSGDTDTDPPDTDTGPPIDTADTGALAIRIRSHQELCSSPDANGADAWQYGIQTDGKPVRALLEIVEANADGTLYGEKHQPLADPEFPDPDGAQFGLMLSVVTDTYTPNKTTKYDCPDQGQMTWKASVFDEAGNRADCLAWGAMPASVATDGCRIEP